MRPEVQPIGDVEEFFALAEALGLEPQSMLDTYCRNWVEATKRRALGEPSPAPTAVEAPAGE